MGNSLVQMVSSDDDLKANLKTTWSFHFVWHSIRIYLKSFTLDSYTVIRNDLKKSHIPFPGFPHSNSGITIAYHHRREIDIDSVHWFYSYFTNLIGINAWMCVCVCVCILPYAVLSHGYIHVTLTYRTVPYKNLPCYLFIDIATHLQIPGNN